MSKKRQLAVEWSVEGLANCLRGEQLRLWTLTTPDLVEDPKEVGRRWSSFCDQMGKELDTVPSGKRGGRVKVPVNDRRWGGVRVSEPHPKGHGWHIHFVTASWLSVDLVREIAQRCGFGRVHVAKPCKGGAKALGAYLAKYLGKSLSAGKGTGARMWSVFGYGREHASRLKDITVDFSGCAVWKASYQAAREMGADHFTAFCQAEVAAFRWWWADVTGEGPHEITLLF